MPDVQDLQSVYFLLFSILDYLIKNYNVILSPHVGGWSVESYYLLSSILADKILEVDWKSNL